jgi:integrase
MRVSEILSLRREQIDFKNSRIVLTDTKNNETRSVPLVGHAKEQIGTTLKVTHLGTSLVFPAFDKKGNARSVNIREAWDAALKKARIADFRFHYLRHTATSYLAMNGATLP